MRTFGARENRKNTRGCSSRQTERTLSLSLSLSFERGIRKNTRGALHGKLKELSLSLSRILFLQEEEEEEEEERERERERSGRWDVPRIVAEGTAATACRLRVITKAQHRSRQLAGDDHRTIDHSKSHLRGSRNRPGPPLSLSHPLLFPPCGNALCTPRLNSAYETWLLSHRAAINKPRQAQASFRPRTCSRGTARSRSRDKLARANGEASALHRQRRVFDF